MREYYKKEFFICLFTGFLGTHKFYEKKIGLGLLYLLTVGLVGFGWIIDTVILFKLAFLTTEEKLEERNIIKAEKKEIRKQEVKEWMEERERRKNSNEVCCPKCGSTSITANKKGWSLRKGLVGAVLINPIGGAATGMIGKNKIIITCLKCGYRFKPGH